MSVPFRLIETMRFENGIGLLDRHLDRLTRSAGVFNIPLDAVTVAEAIRRECSRSCAPEGSFRIRAAVDRFGRVEIRVNALAPTPPVPLRVCLSERRIDEKDLHRRHKTSVRYPYDDEYARATAAGFFEVLFLNSSGALAEGSRTNVLAEIEGELLTPRIDDGALPGVYRSVVLEGNPAAREACLAMEDVQDAEGLYVCNAVIGMVRVQLIDSGNANRGDKDYGA